jgi:hypothetical protein
MRVVETDRSCGRIEFDSKSCLSHQKKRAAGPRLGRTGRRIERGSRSDAFTKAADQFWQLPQSI